MEESQEFLSRLPNHIFNAGILADASLWPKKAYEEEIEKYGKNGYYPAAVGEVMMNRYVLLERLCRGEFSTLWLARDVKTGGVVVVKIKKNNKSYLETTFYEIEVLQKIIQMNGSQAWAAEFLKTRRNPTKKPSKPRNHVVKLLNSFIYESKYDLQFCLVFELLDTNLRTVIDRYEGKGIPLKLAREIVRQILVGLHFLHVHCQVFHHNLQPENVMFAFPKRERLAIDKRGSVAIAGEAQSRLSVAKKLAKDLLGQNQLAEKGKLTPSVYKGLSALYPWYAPGSAEESKKRNPEASFDSAEGLEASALNAEDDKLEDPSEAVLEDRQTDEDGIGGFPEEKFQSEFARIVQENNLTTKKELKNLKRKLKKKMKKIMSKGAVAPKAEISLRVLNGNTRARKYAPRVVKNRKTETEVAGLPEKFNLKLIDFANSCWINKLFQNFYQPQCYKAPECILGINETPAVDVWSLGCIAFEIVTGEKLFQPKVNKNLTCNEEHLAEIIELLGSFPLDFGMSGSHSKRFFDSRGTLKKNPVLSYLNVRDTLTKVHRAKESEAEAFADFLEQMLQWSPQKRATPWQLLQHPWLKGSSEEFFASESEILGNPKLYGTMDPTATPLKCLANEDAFDADKSYSSSEIDDVQDDDNDYYESQESELKFFDRSFKNTYLFSDQLEGYKMDNTAFWKNENR